MATLGKNTDMASLEKQLASAVAKNAAQKEELAAAESKIAALKKQLVAAHAKCPDTGRYQCNCPPCQLEQTTKAMEKRGWTPKKRKDAFAQSYLFSGTFEEAKESEWLEIMWWKAYQDDPKDLHRGLHHLFIRLMATKSERRPLSSDDQKNQTDCL